MTEWRKSSGADEGRWMTEWRKNSGADDSRLNKKGKGYMAGAVDPAILIEKNSVVRRPFLEDYQFTVLWKDDIMADVVLFDRRRQVRIIKHKNTFPENPFYGGEVTPERVYRFLEGRCMDRNRPCLPEYLEGLGLKEYNPYEIVKITHGVMWEDFQWLRFPGEEISWKDVKIRD